MRVSKTDRGRFWERFCSAGANTVLCSTLSASPKSGRAARQCCVTGRHMGTKWGIGISLPIPPPCSLPAPLTASRQPCCWGSWRGWGLWGGCPVTGVVQGTMCTEDFQSLAINKVYAALGRFFPTGCWQSLLLINVLSKWSLLFCLQNIQGVITSKRKVMLKGILLYREQHRTFYEC